MLHTLDAIGTAARMWADFTSTKWSDSFLEMLYFTHLMRCKPGEYIHYDKGCASWHILGRNTLAQNFRGEWLFMSDTDHQFAPDMLHRLLNIKEETGAGVVSAIYQYKAAPHSPVIGVWDQNEHLQPVFDFPRDVNSFPVGAVGGGGLLIDRKVFNEIAKTGESPFDVIGGLSEDYSFCLRCKRLGIPVLVCPQVQTHHLITSALHIEDYQPDHNALANLKPIQASGGTIITP